MKKIYLSFLAGVLLLSTTTINAQCFGGRYHNYVFSGSTVTSNVVYGSNLDKAGATFSLKMDIYQPTGDVATNRPLVIVAHGGSFVGGSKTGNDVVPICQSLAKLGYVAASIDYRTGMTHFPFGGPPDSTDAGAAVMRAVHDGRAAVRYFRQNAAVGGNTYNIDVNNIYFAGVSAGGFISLHIAYMDNLSEFPSYVDTIGQFGLHGGIEGLSGNPGYSSDVKAIVNVCGALGKVAWMQPGDEPVCSFHGNADNTVPYGSAVIYLLGSYPLLVVDGSSTVAARANSIGVENCFTPWYGRDHVPEVGTTAPAPLYYDSMIVVTRNFLEHQVCGVPLNCSYDAPIASIPLGVAEVADEQSINVYPNPSSNEFTVDLSQFQNKEARIELVDVLGKSVKSISGIKNDKLTISRGSLPNGMYLLNITVDGNRYSKRIVLE